MRKLGTQIPDRVIISREVAMRLDRFAMRLKMNGAAALFGVGEDTLKKAIDGDTIRAGTRDRLVLALEREEAVLAAAALGP